MAVGDTGTIYATVLPSTAGNRAATWSVTSGSDLIEYTTTETYNGGRLDFTAKGTGTVTILAMSSEDSSVRAVYTLTIMAERETTTDTVQINGIVQAIADQLFGGNTAIAGVIVFTVTILAIFLLIREPLPVLLIMMPVALIYRLLDILTTDVTILLIIVSVVGLALIARNMWRIDVLGGGTDNNFSYRMIIFAIAILVLLPTFISIYADDGDGDGIDANVEDLLDDYHQFTGSSAASESVWALTGIYTPYYGGGSYGYTDDGWLYGSVVGTNGRTYSPYQYSEGSQSYTVQRGDDGLYRYVVADGETTADGHVNGDLYTAVSFDVNEKSDIFFTSSGKIEEDGRFYYEYSGYRYAFQPLADYTARNADGEQVPVTANTTSLSLIWYEYYGSSGISGQLILSGSDSGVAYLTAQQIIYAFNNTTSTATFAMTFNGVDMNIHIRIDPYQLALGKLDRGVL